MPEDSELAAAIRDLVKQVDYLGNAMQSAADTIAQALAQQNPGSSIRSKGISDKGTFT
jgi:hypothetical protein